MPCYDARSDYENKQKAYKEHGVAARCLYFFLSTHGEAISPELEIANGRWEEGQGEGFDDYNWFEALCSRLKQCDDKQMRTFVMDHFDNPETSALLAWWRKHRAMDEKIN